MNKELFERIVGIFNSGDTSEVANIFSSDYIDHQKPEWLTTDGPVEFEQIVNLARSGMPNLEVTIVGQLLSDDNLVAGRLLWSYDAIERETIEILRINDGKFAEHWGAEAWSKQK